MFDVVVDGIGVIGDEDSYPGDIGGLVGFVLLGGWSVLLLGGGKAAFHFFCGVCSMII